MHPEIIKKEPGSCPICGMALESLGGNEAELEYKEMRLRFLIGLILSIPIVVLAMIPYGGWIQALLATGVVFFVGKFFLIKGFRPVKFCSRYFEPVDCIFHNDLIFVLNDFPYNEAGKGEADKGVGILFFNNANTLLYGSLLLNTNNSKYYVNRPRYHYRMPPL